MTDLIITAYKTCRKCGKTKATAEFYRKSSVKDGFSNSCKICHDLQVNTRIEARSERLNAIDPDTMKRCYRCGDEKPFHAFSKNRMNPDGRAYLCKPCSRKRSRSLYQEVKKEWDTKTVNLCGVKVCGHCKEEKPKAEFHKSIGRRTGLHPWCRGCVIKKNRGERYETLLHYSNGDRPSCRCCGETRIEFLAIDHINGGGGKERKRLGRGGSQFCAYLRMSKYPTGYQTLCHNCNMAKGYYGHCPHTCAHADH